MASHCNDFNTCISELKKLDRQDYSTKRLYTLFTESILDSTFNNTLKEGDKKNWTLAELQDELCYDEQINAERREKLRVLNARRAAKETLAQGGGGSPNPKNNKGKGGGGDNQTPKKPSKKQKTAWKQLRVTIEKKYWSVLSEGQQKEFKEMNDEARSAWWHKNAKDIKKKVPKESPTNVGPPSSSKDNPSEKPPKKVN